MSAGFILPEVAHIPGRNPRPDEAIFAAAKAGIPADPAQLGESAAFRAGFTAFDAGYYWEAHELWEPVWMQAPPASRARHLLQGLIQLANAGLKFRMSRPDAARKALARADYAIGECFRSDSAAVLGLTQQDVASLRAATYAL
ncbi:DUF309 domain-containing protein [Pararhodobacter oceanensis]|uniref:DUF309 domain-containing protein n=1 Tax=Pararhodobacter oceanensis TaxID=2172121 RepID=UPI003A9099ED